MKSCLQWPHILYMVNHLSGALNRWNLNTQAGCWTIAQCLHTPLTSWPSLSIAGDSFYSHSLRSSMFASTIQSQKLQLSWLLSFHLGCHFSGFCFIHQWLLYCKYNNCASTYVGHSCGKSITRFNLPFNIY